MQSQLAADPGPNRLGRTLPPTPVRVTVSDMKGFGHFSPEVPENRPQFGGGWNCRMQDRSNQPPVATLDRPNPVVPLMVDDQD